MTFGAFLSYLNTALTVVIGLIFVPYLIDALGKEVYGLYSMIVSLIAYFGIFDAGFGRTLVRFFARSANNSQMSRTDNLFTVGILLYACSAVFMFILGLILYYNSYLLFGESFSNDEIILFRKMLIIVLCGILINSPINIYSALVLSNERFVFLKAVESAKLILGAVLIVFIVTNNFGPEYLVLSTVSINIICAFTYRFYVNNTVKVSLNFVKLDKNVLREILVYWSWIFLETCMSLIYWNSGQFTLGITKGTASIATLAVIMQIQRFFMTVGNSFSGILLPSISKLVESQVGRDELTKVFIQVGRIQSIVIFGMLSVFIVFGQDLVAFWVGNDFDSVYWLTLIILIPLSIPLVQNAGISILEALNKLKFRSITLALVAVLSLLFQFYFIRSYGLLAVTLSVGLGLVFGQIIIMNWYYHKRVGLDMFRFWVGIFKTLLIPIIFLLLSSLIKSQIIFSNLPFLVVAVMLFLLTYFCLLWNFVLNKVEKRFLKSILIKN